MQLQLPVHSYRLNSVPGGSARLVNCYAEQAPAGSRSPVMLKRAPGIISRTSLGAAGRGVHATPDALFAVAGQTLYKVSSSWVATEIGTVSGGKPVWMADNNSQLVVGSSGGRWYVYSLSSGTYGEISDGDFAARGASSAQFVDNYISFTEPGSGRWFTSDLADADSFDSLNFATAEGAPDNVVSQVVDHREVVLLGEKSVEIWYNAGVSGFPFQRSPNGFVELGCAANRGSTKQDNSVFWLANDFSARRLSGATGVRVSSHGTEEMWRGYSTVADCECYAYTWNGHHFVVYRFPTAGACWVYDVTTGEWHERQSYGYDGWNVSGICEFQGSVVVQNSLTGALGTFSDSTYTEFGGVQRASWTYQPVYNEQRRMQHSLLEIVPETGVGLVTGQGSDPLLTLEISNDSGRTWLTLPTRSLGEQGRYHDRVRWHRLGQSRSRVYRASISDPVPLTVLDTVLEVE